MKKGFLSSKINELKKNKTNDSSWTLINMLFYPSLALLKSDPDKTSTENATLSV